MFAVPLFSSLLEWLASTTGDQAKDDGVPKLDFPIPSTAPKEMRLTPSRPMERWCCQMGQVAPPGITLVLDASTMGSHPHRFRARDSSSDPTRRLTNEGGTVGFLYTRYGGFIDLAHARDFIDQTNYFAELYRQHASSSENERVKYLWDDGARVHLFAEKAASPPDLTTCAVIGAKLAFDNSIWHEIESYYGAQKYSSFAPEDLFSNAVGVLAGFRALFNLTSFDRAAEQSLKEVLELLGPVRAEINHKAMQYVKDHWWSGTISVTGETKRRHFLSPGGLQSLTNLAEIKSSHLRTVSGLLRDHARLAEGATIDQP